MSKSRKILSAVLAVVMVLSIFAVSAFAYTATDTGYTQAWALDNVVKVDDTTYTADVKLTTNYPVGGIQFELDIDNANVTLTDAVKGSAITCIADVSYNTDNSRVVIVPSTGEGGTTTGIDLTEGGVIATLTFALSDSTQVANVNIKNDPKGYGSDEDVDGTLIAGRIVDNDITKTPAVGQTVTVGEAVKIGTEAAAKADLALKTSAQAGIIIDTNKTLGGLYAGVVYGFVKTSNTTFRSTTYLTNSLEATNGGTLEFGRTIGTAGYGTGTTITVKNADSTVSAVYIVCIFGDVNGDGIINTNDSGYAKKNAGTLSKTATIQNLAANCQAVTSAVILYTLNANDYTAIKNYANNKSNKFSETDLAAKQFANKTYFK